MLEFSHNSRRHADRKKTSFELMMGYEPRGTPATTFPNKVPQVEARME